MWKLPETNSDPIWEVILEMEKDYMMCRKGQTINEIVQASDKDKAIEKALAANDMEPDALDVYAIVKGIRLWTNEQTI